MKQKQILNLSFLNNFHPVISKRKRRITVYGSVTRYGPQSIASVTWPNQVLSFSLSLSLSLSLFLFSERFPRARASSSVWRENRRPEETEPDRTVTATGYVDTTREVNYSTSFHSAWSRYPSVHCYSRWSSDATNPWVN